MLYFLFAILIFETTGGTYLYFAPDSTIFYQYSLLFHILAGFLLLLPLTIYLCKHFLEITDKISLAPFTKGGRGDFVHVIGYLSFIVVTFICLTGIYQTFIGFQKESY